MSLSTDLAAENTKNRASIPDAALAVMDAATDAIDAYPLAVGDTAPDIRSL